MTHQDLVGLALAGGTVAVALFLCVARALSLLERIVGGLEDIRMSIEAAYAPSSTER